MAEGHGGTGWVSGAVVSLKRARPSELLVYIMLPRLPPKDTLESYALEFTEGHNEKLSNDITRWSAWSLLLLIASCVHT